MKYSDNEDVSIKAGLPGPAHPLKTTGEHSNNTFLCDALTGNGNVKYSNCNKKYNIYTDTDIDDKTEITDIICKFNGRLVAMEVPLAMQRRWQSKREGPGTNPGTV